MDVDSQPVGFGRVVKWSQFISNFLEEAGLSNALRGLREDLIVMSIDWEKKNVPPAIKNLQIALLDNLVELPRNVLSTEDGLEAFKDEQLAQQNGPGCLSRTKITKEISIFLAENRARLNRSNRQEFLRNFHEKKRHQFPDKEQLTAEEEDMLFTTCARTDAKPQQRDVQIKFDIAKNEDGPLRKTVQQTATVARGGLGGPTGSDPGEPNFARHPGLAERFENIEEHLALRYIPAPPYSLMQRVSFIEEYIIRMEREYPPWAALHFKQPHRGWPPLPADNPIIVPSHLTSSARPDLPEHFEAGPSIGRRVSKQKSSLQRAIMDKLDIQRALTDGHPPKTS